MRPLAHWGPNKMADISQTAFWNAFSLNIIFFYIFIEISMKFLIYKGVVKNESTLVRVIAWCQDIIKANDDSVYWRIHDDVIKWKHFPRYWPFVRGIHWSPVNPPHKGQWRRALVFSLICAWINGWVNNREASDLLHDRTHYDVTLMIYVVWSTRVALTRWTRVTHICVGNLTIIGSDDGLSPGHYLDRDFIEVCSCGSKKIWWLCLVPTSTTRFASDVEVQNGQNLIDLYKENDFYEQWHLIP